MASLGAWLPSSAHSPGFLWQRQLLPEIDQGSVASWRGTGVQGGGTENTGVPVGLLVPAARILQTFRIPSGVCPPPKTALSLRECPTGAQQATPKRPSLDRLSVSPPPIPPTPNPRLGGRHLRTFGSGAVPRRPPATLSDTSDRKSRPSWSSHSRALVTKTHRPPPHSIPVKHRS